MEYRMKMALKWTPLGIRATINRSRDGWMVKILTRSPIGLLIFHRHRAFPTKPKEIHHQAGMKGAVKNVRRERGVRVARLRLRTLLDVVWFSRRLGAGSGLHYS